MEEKWVTLKDGRRVRIKSTSEYMNDLIRNDEKIKLNKKEPTDKRVRIDKKYGDWYYEKEVDMEDRSNYMYYFYGIDDDWQEWSWSTPYYHEMIEFIKADKDTKQLMKDSY